MELNKKVNSVFGLFGFNLRRVPSPLFSSINIPREDYSVNGNKVYLKKLSISIEKGSENPLLQGYKNALRISKELGGRYYYSSDNDLIVQVGDAKFIINDAEELFIINEVFSDGSYNIITGGKPIVVIDIGMNVGVTSIFFSTRKDVEKIYSYELFAPTFEKALRNININNSGNKIQAFNYGLGKEDAKLSLPYSAEQKGRMGLNGLPQNRNYNDVSMEEVAIKRVSDEFISISRNHAKNYIVCKMDCEGAEYDLIEDLHNNLALDKVDAYMIEWHYKKPDQIISSLIQNNFTVFYSTFPGGVAGMLYATKR